MFWTIDQNFRKWLPRLQAHRGHWVGGLPQNSLAAMQSAFQLNYKMVECDVRLTADKQVVLFHDDRVQGQLIRNMSLEKLNEIMPINSLIEIFTWIQSQSTKDFKLNIELKSNTVFNFELEKKVSALIQKFGLAPQVMVSSFNPFSLARFRYFNPRIYRVFLQTFEDEPGNNWFVRTRFFNFMARPHGLNLRYDDWSEEKFGPIAQKVPVALWTLNDPDLYLKLKGQIHGVISDQLTPDFIKD